jgi:hypothetical protein
MHKFMWGGKISADTTPNKFKLFQEKRVIKLLETNIRALKIENLVAMESLFTNIGNS